MKLFKKVAIIGTGLIGGSLAQAIKKNRLADEIVGVSRHKRSLALAKQHKAIDRGSQSLEIIKGADLVVFATPVDVILKVAPKARQFIDDKAIVSDVGSTKELIVKNLEKIFPRFVGSHPLAGSEKRSIANANPSLFKDSLCILTPTRNTDTRALKRIALLWKQVGAKTSIIDPAVHDTILAFVSHLPHVAAFSLIDAVPSQYLQFSATGLKDTTRIAASDSEIWTEIFLSNRQNILKAIFLWQKEISQIQIAIKKKDSRQLSLLLQKAKVKRERLL